MDDPGNTPDEPSAASSADSAAGDPAVEDELADRIADVSARAEAVAERVAALSEQQEVQPAADAEPQADAEPEVDAEPEADGLKARPRPWSGAPVVYEQPAVSLTKGSSRPGKPDPIAAFFAHNDEDDRRRWFRRKDGQDGAGSAEKDKARAKDKTADKEKPAEKGDRKAWPAAARRTVRFLVVVAIAVVAALLLRSYVVQPFYVPSESMEPTLHGCKGCNDDHVLVEKLSYRFHDVQAGDIVVFHRPSTWPVSQVPDGVLIKRVIGVAGDRLTLKHGRVFRNGQPLDESYVNQKCKRGTTDKDGSTAKKTYPRIPPGEVFVMGDNRCDSEDSRFFGDVPTSDIIGRAFLIIWPVGRIHSLN